MAQQIRYLGATLDQACWGGNDDPRYYLTIGTIYTVKRTETHSWHTKIELEEWPGQVFNDASFAYVEEEATTQLRAAPDSVRRIHAYQADDLFRGHVIPKTIIDITEPIPEHAFKTHTGFALKVPLAQKSGILHKKSGHSFIGKTNI